MIEDTLRELQEGVIFEWLLPVLQRIKGMLTIPSHFCLTAFLLVLSLFS
jgi:hypothetical protein